MPMEKDPSFTDWSWFPHGSGKDYTFTKYNSSNQVTSGISNDSGWRAEIRDTELTLSNLYLSMLHKLGVEPDHFGGSTEPLMEI